MDSILFIISQIFSYIIIFLSFTMKIPQIYSMLKSRSTKGISLNSCYLDFLNQYFMFMYVIHQKVTIKVWGECLSIGIQNLLVVFLFWLYEGKDTKTKDTNKIRLFWSLILIGNMCIGFFTNLYPHYIWVGFALTNMPSVFISRFYQIKFLMDTKDSGSLSASSFAMRYMKNFMQVFYLFIQERDYIIMFNQTYNGCSSLFVFCLIKYYSKPRINGTKEIKEIKNN